MTEVVTLYVPEELPRHLPGICNLCAGNVYCKLQLVHALFF